MNPHPQIFEEEEEEERPFEHATDFKEELPEI